MAKLGLFTSEIDAIFEACNETVYLDDIVEKIIQDRGYTYEFVCEDRGHDTTGHADTCQPPLPKGRGL